MTNKTKSIWVLILWSPIWIFPLVALLVLSFLRVVGAKAEKAGDWIAEREYPWKKQLRKHSK